MKLPLENIDMLDLTHGGKQPAMWVAIALSLLVHAAALWQWPLDLRMPSFDPAERADMLVVQLAPPPVSPPSPVPHAQRPSPLSLPAAKAVPRPRTPPPVIALNQQAPESASPVAAAPAVTAVPSPRPPAGDLSSYIEARRRARAESAPAAAPDSRPSAPPAEDENARANRIAAANVGADRVPTFGQDPTRSGGIFSIQRLGYDYAEFIFFGWNRDIRRNTSQLIEVRRGGASDIRVAVVRRMISIIREYEAEDFLWESKRLGRYLTLSARARDNAGLEEFMMREFFDTYRGPQ